MAAVTAAAVKELREKTGAGMMDCKKALVEKNGDVAAAKEWLREKGLAKAGAKTGRVTAEGAVASYIHGGGKFGALVEVNCETDFVARTEEFQTLAHDLAVHAVAMKPKYVRREEIPEDVIAHEKEIYTEQCRESGKPQAAWDKIVSGKLEKFYEEVCMVDQPYAKDLNKKVHQVITEAVAKIGENITLRRFVRFELGDGLEKKKNDLAAEVAEMTKGA